LKAIYKSLKTYLLEYLKYTVLSASVGLLSLWKITTISSGLFY